MSDIGTSSYNIVMATEIIGLSHRERELVANIVRFNHIPFGYYEQTMEQQQMDRQTYLTVAKLTAILRLSAGMDRSHKQKLKRIKATLQENELIISADTMEDLTLEKGYFDSRAAFFQEVFSVTPVLKQRKKI